MDDAKGTLALEMVATLPILSRDKGLLVRLSQFLYRGRRLTGRGGRTHNNRRRDCAHAYGWAWAVGLSLMPAK